MNSKSLKPLLGTVPILLLMVSVFPSALAAVSNPYHFIAASIGGPATVDPAWCYDTGSQELIFNVYETLVWWDRENINDFIGLIAEDFTVSGDGLTYTFTIREGMPWHDPAYGMVSPEDVEYSMERVLVTDAPGGPQWMFYEPMLSCFGADTSDPSGFGQRIDNVVTVDGNIVTIHLEQVYPPFLHVLSNSFGGSILCKQWCIDNGDWPGWDNDPEHDGWVAYTSPDVSPLDEPAAKMMGSGPYKFDYWDVGVEWSIVKFDDYWGGWPMTRFSRPARGYVERYTYKQMEEWTTRRDSFLVGDIDQTYVPRAQIGQVEGQPGIECIYPLEAIGLTGLFFNYNISIESPYLGDPPHDPGALHESGIPVDFFSDMDVRKGLASCIDYATVINEALLGEALFPVGPLAKGLAPDFINPDNPTYTLDLAKAEDHLRAAWGGQLWTTGFTLDALYNTGNLEREMICSMLKENLEAMNAKFHVNVQAVDWGTVYIPYLFSKPSLLTFFIIGWVLDYPDANNFIYTFMGSYGSFSYFQSVVYTEAVGGNEYVDNLLNEAFFETDNNIRRTKYYELQQIYFDECASVAAFQAFGRHWQRNWLQGWYFNPLYETTNYAYVHWKEELPAEDLNNDGNVDIFDVVGMAKAFGSYYEVGHIHPKWDSTADLNKDRVVDIFDVVTIAKKFGYTAPPWTPPP